jgi:hypothetical protein
MLGSLDGFSEIGQEVCPFINFKVSIFYHMGANSCYIKGEELGGKEKK